LDLNLDEATASKKWFMIFVGQLRDSGKPNMDSQNKADMQEHRKARKPS